MTASLSKAILDTQPDQVVLPNPKQNGVPHVGRMNWFPYYAGFSSVFVDSVMRVLRCSSKTTVCDPWNGAGTTTQTAFDAGVPSIGFDLNPVMTSVALARTVSPQSAGETAERHRSLISDARRRRSQKIHADDPLRVWFTDDVVRGIRFVAAAINESCDTTVERNQKALHETAVFRTMKTMLTPFRSSNPTWIRRPESNQRVCGTVRDFLDAYDETARSMFADLRDEAVDTTMSEPPVWIETASSLKLPVKECSIHRVIGSPPYCTRIDYAVTTSVELAYLGYDITSNERSMRHSMTGTSTIRPKQPKILDAWGTTCCTFLNAIRRHPSKASESYYLKTHLQYFDDLYRSLQEIFRVLVRSGDCLLVVQDSYYKELHNDLPQIVAEIGSGIGFQLENRKDFPVTLDMARVNPKANQRRITDRPVESVIHFKKPK